MTATPRVAFAAAGVTAVHNLRTQSLNFCEQRSQRGQIVALLLQLLLLLAAADPAARLQLRDTVQCNRNELPSSRRIAAQLPQ